jgi:hypothetical protein
VDGAQVLAGFAVKRKQKNEFHEHHVISSFFLFPIFLVDFTEKNTQSEEKDFHFC